MHSAAYKERTNIRNFTYWKHWTLGQEFWTINFCTSGPKHTIKYIFTEKCALFGLKSKTATSH